MFCNKCGAKLADDAQVCPECGVTVTERPSSNAAAFLEQAQAQTTSGQPDAQQAQAASGQSQASNPYAYAQQPFVPDSNAKNQAIAGLVLGIVAIVIVWFPVSNIVAFILGIIGIVLAASSLKKIPEGAQNRGIAIAGLVISILSLVLAVPLIICVCATAGIIGLAAV